MLHSVLKLRSGRDYLKTSLQGHRLLRGRYQPVPRNPDGFLDSLTTGLTLRVEGENLRLTDTATGERLLWVAEESAARQAAEQWAKRGRRPATGNGTRLAAEERAEREAAVRRALEEELARLRAERGR